MGTGDLNTGGGGGGGNPAMDKHLIQGGVETILVSSCYRNWEKLRPDGPLGLCADFILPHLPFSIKQLGVLVLPLYGTLAAHCRFTPPQQVP